MDNTVHGILVHPDLAPEWVSFSADSITAMRRILDCQWVERVTTPIPGVSMWIDEEGALTPDTPVNPRCSGILYPGRIVGPGLLTGIDPTGEMVNLTPQQISALAGRGITVRPRPGLRADVQWLTDEEHRQLTARVAERIQVEGAES